jgi:hypothetical protein
MRITCSTLIYSIKENYKDYKKMEIEIAIRFNSKEKST